MSDAVTLAGGKTNQSTSILGKGGKKGKKTRGGTLSSLRDISKKKFDRKEVGEGEKGGKITTRKNGM